jgi:hypothetical protein
MSAQNGEAVGEHTIKQMGYVSSNPRDHIGYATGHLNPGFDQLYFHTTRPDQHKFLLDDGRDALPKLKED